MTTITRPGPTNLQNEPGYELDLLWDQMADVVEATEIVANAALPAATAATTYAPIASGVTNGDSHDHSGGDGAQIAYSGLSGLPTLGTAAALNVGIAASNVIQLDGTAKLPAVDGSQLTNLPTGGVSDHGALTGLADDDHSQYHTDARGDARYAPIGKGVTNGDSHNHDGGDGAQIAYSGLSGLPTLGGAAALNVGIITGTVAAGDDARLSDARAPTAHAHVTADVTGFAAAALAAAPAETVSTVGSLIAGATDKATPVDADTVALSDSESAGVLKKWSWANIKTSITTALTGIFAKLSGVAGGQTLIGGTQAADSLTLQGTAATGTTSTDKALRVLSGDAGAIEAVTVLNSGNVGIANPAAPYLLSVGTHGTNSGLSITQTGKLSLGADVGISYTSSVLSHPVTLTSRTDVTDDGTLSRTAIAGHLVLNPPSNSSNTHRALNAYCEVPAECSVNPGNIYAASAYGFHYGSGTLGVNIGLAVFSYNQSTGTITSNFAYNNQAYNQSTGIITANYSLNCISSNQSSGSIVTNKGGELIARNSGSGLVTTQAGLSVKSRKSSTGSVTTSTGLNIECSNTNATGSITTLIGLEIGRAVTSPWINTGTITDCTVLFIGSSTNIGTNKKVIHSDNPSQSYLSGALAIGLDASSAKLHSVATTEQLRLGYDATKYASFTVDSAGSLKIAAPLILTPPASLTPASNGDMTIQATSDTSLTFRYKGSDGVVRSASLTLS